MRATALEGKWWEGSKDEWILCGPEGSTVQKGEKRGHQEGDV